MDSAGLSALYNAFTKPAFKIFALFTAQSKTSQNYYDAMHYKYLRSSHVKLNVGNLFHLNQVLTEVLPGDSMYQKMSGKK